MYRNSLEGMAGNLGAVESVPFEALADGIWRKIGDITILPLGIVNIKVEELIPDSVEPIIKMGLIAELKKKIMDSTQIEGNEASIKQIASGISDLAISEALDTISSQVDPMVKSVIDELTQFGAAQFFISSEPINGVSPSDIQNDYISMSYLGLHLGGSLLKPMLTNKIYDFTVETAVELGIIEQPMEIPPEPLPDIAQITRDSVEYARTITRESLPLTGSVETAVNELGGQALGYLQENLMDAFRRIPWIGQDRFNALMMGARTLVISAIREELGASASSGPSGPRFTTATGPMTMVRPVGVPQSINLPSQGGDMMLPLAAGAGLIGLFFLLKK